MTLVCGNIRRICEYSRGFLWTGASNDSEVVDDGNLWHGDLSGYFFRNVRDKASNITWRYAIPCRLQLLAQEAQLPQRNSASAVQLPTWETTAWGRGP